tara:strand:+ start:415 stop:2088 length:1674 start_codon:yes stop_codon:yes gene_type:complete
MKKVLLGLLTLTFGLAQAQRYSTEVFSQVQVTSNVEYGVNVDFLTSDLSNQGQIITDITDIQTNIAMGNPIPAAYFDPADASTDVKLTKLLMDVYEPMGDTQTERPLMIYIHTGNFLPPPLNGSPLGLKTDSAAIIMCERWAKRGFVAISMDYRLGWNPVASGPTGPIVRRATLLNAVYRALHDTKHLVRGLKAEAANTNPYSIDTNKIILFGEGSGGYVALAYATLDKQSETEIQKFIYPGTTDSSYVQPSLVGDVEGLGGLLNLYTDNGSSSEVAFVVNSGGALADTSWLEAGDAPMVSIQCVRDPFAPFGEGTVVVPTTQEDVVDVQGANVFMVKANALGNNDSYQVGYTYNDSYTLAARRSYGATYSYIYPAPFDQITVNTAEGLFPVVRPLGASTFQNEGSPWQWWDPNSPLATSVVAAGPPPVTAHQASLASNMDMSSSKGRTYSDSLIGYCIPRIINSLALPIGLEEGTKLASKIKLFPNPASSVLNIKSDDPNISIDKVVIRDLSGKSLMTVDVNSSQEKISIENLSQGAYLVEVVSGKEAFTQKFIKK